ncbi:cilia- and flagella-associated protein 43 isoform X2 [Oryzias melastigma]|uniref:cilia- and flagella-associated protein 43 isoform X2 n=1 Tax=Oryzias melastigma TaxID=30732 RepID=UPI000CF7BECA|nr:cilia- and flagella-associated protein 43 isoform X2 [Oryzias melastigma]
MDEIESLNVRWIQGFTNKKIEFVNNEMICYTCGHHICFLNLKTKKRHLLQSPGRGISALTADGSSSIFAFSEQKLSPSIFVYKFPELALKNELKGTAKLKYTCLTLSDSGPFLGCCSSLPDYTLTVWNWEKAEPICKQAGVGRDIISLVFNPWNWLQLCALSSTSVIVWHIEKSDSITALKPRVVKLPETDGSFAERPSYASYTVQHRTTETTLLTSSTVTPSAVCWTPTSEIYVGCVEGFLLHVDPENLSVSILYNPKVGDAVPELTKFSFQGLTLSKNGVIALGKNTEVYSLEVGGQVSITRTWQLEKPVDAVKLSPDNNTVLLTSNTGEIYAFNPEQSEEIVKVLDIFSGNFLAAEFLNTDRNICVDSGELQLWSSEGSCLGSLSLQAEVTSLACCPAAHYAAVGTAAGSVLFVDLNVYEKPRVVHQVQLYHTAVLHVVFDQEGHYLLTSGSDSHIYVLEAKPSLRFSVIGYTVVCGRILSLSTQCLKEEVRVLVLCVGLEDNDGGGSLLTAFSLPSRGLAGSDYVDRHGRLSALRGLTYEVPHPLHSCSLGVNEAFAYCNTKKTIQRFHLIKDTKSISSEKIKIKPVQEVEGHPLGPASLLLSPDCIWLASVGQDGLLYVRQTASMENITKLQCHLCNAGGIQRVSFSTDGLTLLTTGFRDDCLVCTELRTRGLDTKRQSTCQSLKKTLSIENPILMKLTACDQEAPWLTHEVRGETSDVSKQDEGESCHKSPSSPPTWLENRQKEVIQEDNEKYYFEKKKLKETVKQLSDTIQKLIVENESLPEEEFSLTVKEQRRLDTMVEQEVALVRAGIEQDIVEKSYLYDVLKRECWDSMMIKRTAIKAFYSELAVQNFPLKERTAEELEDLRRVQNMRKIEKAASSISGFAEQEDEKAPSCALTGSFSTQMGFSNPHLYDQFSLQSTEQRISQIILLQDVIYGIKTAFNAEFAALQRQKVLELQRVRDNNACIREIMLKLDMNQELWEPCLTDAEQPENVLTVDDSEIKAEMFFTPENKEEEERWTPGEGNHSEEQVDDGRKQAIDEIIGVFEVKQVDILKTEILPPEFVLTKADAQLSEEEKKAYEEYEKNLKDLNQKKEKYRNSLESEMRKLMKSTKDGTEGFDEALFKLLKKKVKCTIAINQEELKITYLVDSVLEDEDMRNRELQLKSKLEEILAQKVGTGEEVKTHQDEVQRFQEMYDSIVAEDKELDKNFRKDFLNVPNTLVDQLYKLFKRRPRGQKIKTPSQTPDALNQILKAMDELDDPDKMPFSLNPSVWQKFCLVRRSKIESEQKVITHALTLAEMQAFLQRRRDEDNAFQEEINNLSEAIENLRRKRNCHLMDSTVQIILKQGQVEPPTTELTADPADTHLLLYHKNKPENLRRIIRTLAEQKIAVMEQRKGVHKRIIQLEWEHKVVKKKIEDVSDKSRDVKMLRLTEEQQDMTRYSKSEQGTRIAQKASMLEKNMASMTEAQQQSIRQCTKEIKQISKQTDVKNKETSTLELKLPDIRVDVAQLRHVCEAAGPEHERAKAKERHLELAVKSNLKALVKAQAEELTALFAEVERLTKKNFTSVYQLKYS